MIKQYYLTLALAWISQVLGDIASPRSLYQWLEGGLRKRQEAVAELMTITHPKETCSYGKCIDTPALAEPKLNRYKSIARLLNVGYCDTNLVSSWSCGVCKDEGSPVKNTTDVLVFSTKDNTVTGFMGVSHDLQSVFVTFKGARQYAQWARVFAYDQISLGDNVKVHRKC